MLTLHNMIQYVPGYFAAYTALMIVLFSLAIWYLKFRKDESLKLAQVLIPYWLVSSLLLNFFLDVVVEKTEEKYLGVAPILLSTLDHFKYSERYQKFNEQDQNYHLMIDLQKKWLQANPKITDVYTMAKNAEGKNIFIVDSETDYDRNGFYEGDREVRTAIGEIYEKDLPEIEQAFSGKESFTITPYVDRWGRWISAFYPIKDPAGKTVGVLGVDLVAQDFESEIELFAGICFLFFSPMYGLLISFFYFRGKLKNTLDEITAFSRQKTNFTASVSHEFRTPINGILGSTNLLSETYLNEEQQSYIDMIKNSSDVLLTLVNDIMDLSKIESKKLQLETVKFDIKELFNSQAKSFEFMAKNKGLLFTYHCSLQQTFFEGDSIRIKQILNNFVSNAIKFTKEGGVQLHLGQKKLDGDNYEIQISVIDTGIGISSENLKKLFKAYNQLDGSTTRKYGGTGLGLTISKQLCQMMGGEITVESELGKGTSFYIRIPLKATLSEKVVDNKHEEDLSQLSNQYPISIIIADDVPVNLTVLKKFLEKYGYSPEVAENGQQVLEALKHKTFDLLFLDCHMPEMDGYQVATALRGQTNKPFIVAVTANSGADEKQKCLAAGMDEFLSKPFKPADIVKYIKHAGMQKKYVKAAS